MIGLGNYELPSEPNQTDEKRQAPLKEAELRAVLRYLMPENGIKRTDQELLMKLRYSAIRCRTLSTTEKRVTSAADRAGTWSALPSTIGR